MKKKVLFVLRSAGIGGTATSMYNLLSLLKEQGVDADVLLFSYDGSFTEQFNNVSNLLPEEKTLAAISCSSSALKKRGVVSYAIRIAYALFHRVIGVRLTQEFFYKLSARKFDKKYSAVVAFQEDLTTEYVMHIRADKRIAWCHMDYDTVAKASHRSIERSKEIYSKYDYIMCVSEIIKNSMMEKLGCPEEKIDVVYNTIPPEYIKSRAEDRLEDELLEREFCFISMGRLVDRKRFDRVIFAAEALKSKNIEFVWNILGDGPEREKIERMIKEHSLENNVILLGAKTNPFPYIKVADCFVMSSENEGQPMVLNEALTLGKPVISTEFSSSKEVVNNRVNGLIVPNSTQGLIEGVSLFVDDADLRGNLLNGARNFSYDNDRIINQVKTVLGMKK